MMAVERARGGGMTGKLGKLIGRQGGAGRGDWKTKGSKTEKCRSAAKADLLFQVPYFKQVFKKFKDRQLSASCFRDLVLNN